MTKKALSILNNSPLNWRWDGDTIPVLKTKRPQILVGAFKIMRAAFKSPLRLIGRAAVREDLNETYLTKISRTNQNTIKSTNVTIVVKAFPSNGRE